MSWVADDERIELAGGPECAICAMSGRYSKVLAFDLIPDNGRPAGRILLCEGCWRVATGRAPKRPRAGAGQKRRSRRRAQAAA